MLLPVTLAVRTSANTRPGPNTIVSVDGVICDMGCTWSFRGNRARERAEAFIARVVGAETDDPVVLIRTIAAAELGTVPLPGEGFVLACAILAWR